MVLIGGDFNVKIDEPEGYHWFHSKNKSQWLFYDIKDQFGLIALNTKVYLMKYTPSTF